MAVLQTKIFRGCILLSNKEAYPAFKGSGIQFIYKDKDYKSGDTVQIRWRPDSDSPAIWLSDTLTVSGTPAEPIFDWARSSGLNLPDKSAIQIWITRDGEEVYRTNICPLQRVDSKSGSSAGQYRRVLTRSASEFTFNDSTIATAGEYSFYDCDGLTEVKINNVSRINNNAFAECDNLKDIWLLRNSVATLESVNAIPNTVENIWVPRDLEHTYEAAPVWKDLVDCEERIKPYPPEVITLGHVDFQCIEEFSMSYALVGDSIPNSIQPGKWDGQLFYSTDGVNWQEWSKVVAIDKVTSKLGADSKHHIYLRGVGNHKLTDTVETEQGTYWCSFTMGSTDPKISVVGKLENMFDCERVAAGAHPHMAENACHLLFGSPDCEISRIDNNFLSGLTPTSYCYAYMFAGRDFKDEVLKDLVFSDKVAPYCYAYMFQRCYHLKSAPALPATTLAEGCYKGMFDRIDELITPPVLSPIGTTVTLAESCYEEMFYGCWDLASIPSIKATNFPAACCKKMFEGCGTILSETKTGDFQNYYRLPTEGEAVVASNAFEGMFDDVTVISGKSYYANKYVAPPIPEPIPNLCFTNIFNDVSHLKVVKNGEPAARDIKYSFDNLNFMDCPIDVDINVDPGKKIYFKGNNPSGFNSSFGNYYNFIADNSFKVSGNIMSLIDNGTCTTTTIPGNYCFFSLFENCTAITTIPDLPATTLSTNCYYRMFKGCTGLVDLSSYTLPAEDLSGKDYCYLHMFDGCTSLVKAPAIAAKKMGNQTCRAMFEGCTSLQYAPALPATTLADYCYGEMFSGCAALKHIPSIQTDVFPDSCVKGMFANTGLNLTTEYSADRQYYRMPRAGQATVTGSGIAEMFGQDQPNPNPNTLYYVNAESVNPSVPEMLYFYAEDGAATITLKKMGSPKEGTFSYKKGADSDWVTYTPNSEISLADKDVVLFKGNFPEGLSTSQYNRYYFSMTGKVYADGNIMSLIDNGACTTTTIPNAGCFYGMFCEAQSLTHAPSLPATQLTNSCYYQMFFNCKALQAAPALPATNLAKYCYEQMFYNCTAITTPPVLPATTLAEECYCDMFQYCTGLTTAPALPATTLFDNCYNSMFMGCTSLTIPPALPATELAYRCYHGMFIECSNLTTTPMLPAETLAESCYEQMFDSCTNLTTALEMKAKTPERYCCQYMFYKCNKLKNIPSIQFTTFDALCCCRYMFRDTGLTLATEASATHTQRYRIPASGTHTGDVGYQAFTDMFGSEASPETLNIDTNYYVNADSVTPEIPEYVSYFYLENATTANTSVDVAIAVVGTLTTPPTLKYNTGSGWSDYTLGTAITLANSGDKVQFKGTNNHLGERYDKYCKVTTTGDINAGGNIMTLVDETGESTEIPGNYCFASLFYECGKLKSATSLTLPATILKPYCYQSMFYGCTTMTAAPSALPATIMAQNCYGYMFQSCYVLAKAPAMTINTTASGCCYQMFSGDGTLNNISDIYLNAQTLGTGCYYSMFSSCISLTAPPTMNIRSAAEECCRRMFQGCNNEGFISAANITINATASSSYREMFYNCTKLTTPPTFSSSAISLNSYCFQEMFNGCTSLATAPSFTVSTAATQCCSQMFYGCENLANASGIEIDTTAQSCCSQMFRDCHKLAAAPSLPATQLSKSCYLQMFYGCYALTTPPVLPATELVEQCYNQMFYYCLGFTDLSSYSLPAMTAAVKCYNNMFNSCKNLTKPPVLPATTLANSCYFYMFSGCSKLTSIPALPAIELKPSCYESMFRGCSLIKMSESSGSPYVNAYRIPTSGTGTTATDALLDMFANTGGLFKGTPAINATYYTSNTIIKPVDYLTFTANTASSTIGVAVNGTPTRTLDLWYSTDKTTWTQYTPAASATMITLANVGDKIYWKGVNSNGFSESGGIYYQFKMTGSFAGSGNIMTLIDGTGDALTIPNQYCFYYLFYGCTSLTSSPDLPATTITSYCYKSMFNGCANLVAPPATLPAMATYIDSYAMMFVGCSNLTSIPTLPATSLYKRSYYGMFMRCNALTDLSSYNLPAQTVAANCYQQMFDGCSGLTKAPGISATTVRDYGCDQMFQNCTSLTVAPSFSINEAGTYCCSRMFYGCNNAGFTNASGIIIAATASSSYENMFYSCTNLTTPPALSATTLASSCYKNMFLGCTSLTSAPALPATTLVNQCYYRMFQGCEGLAMVPSFTVDAVSGTQSCYQMFINCTNTNFKDASGIIINATAQKSYREMFYGCSKLTTPAILNAESLADDCYQQMFAWCSNLTSLPTLPAITLTNTCYQKMFEKCTSLKISADKVPGSYEIPCSIPASGTVVSLGTNSVGDMFNNISSESPWSGTPEITVGGSWTGYLYGIVPDYLKFTAEQANSTVYVKRGNGTPKADNLQYRVNGSGSWLTYTLPDRSSSGASISLTSVGDYVEFRGNNPDGFNLDSSSFENYYTFKGTGKLSASGDIMTLIGYDAKITTIPNEYCFTHLFFYNDVLTSAENLILSATTLKTGCYEFMFYGCSSLTAAPALPATTLYSYCYRNMFARCTSLTTPPALPATTLGMDCYKDMFLKCTSMTRIPSLPATTMVTQCYYWLFEDCSQLGFSTTKDSTYKYAFRCPSEGTLTTAENWNKEMFLGTATVGTIPYPEADTMYYCNVEVYPPIDNTDYLTFTANEASATVNMYTQGTPTGSNIQYSLDKSTWNTFTPGTTSAITLTNVGDKVYFKGNNPSGFNADASNRNTFQFTGSIAASGNIMTLIDETGETTTIPSTYCFGYLFYSCTSLTSSPSLPATTLTEHCYEGMFDGCTSLTTIPKLDTNVGVPDYAYAGMFYNCSQVCVYNQSGEGHTTEWLIFSSTESNSLSNMATGTGGDTDISRTIFTHYTSNTVV